MYKNLSYLAHASVFVFQDSVFLTTIYHLLANFDLFNK